MRALSPMRALGRLPRSIRAAAVLSAVLTALPAGAQEFRPDPDEVRGARVGVFLFSPSIAIDARYDDNIFREESGAQDSVILRVVPKVGVASDWNRHAIRLDAEMDAGRFLSSSDDDYIDGRIAFEGELDATRAARLRVRAFAARDHEERGDDDAPASLAKPVELTRLGVEATGQYAPGRLRIQPSLALGFVDFEDAPLTSGGRSDQDDRDRLTLRAGLFAGWRYSRKTELFLDADIAWTDFQTPLDGDGFDRDNVALRALGGVRWEASRQLETTLAAGLERRRFDDDALSGFSAFAIEGEARWTPTPLIEIEARLAQRVEETTIAPAAGADVATAEIRGRYAIRRLVDLTAEAGFERRAFRGADRRDETFALGFGVEWSVRRGATIFANYKRVDERSDAPGEDHRSNQIAIGARYEF